MIPLLLLAQMVEVPAPGIAQPVPPTSWNCNFQAADGSMKFTMAGMTPLFPKGWDPNSAKFTDAVSNHPDPRAFKRIGIDPGHASDWFREFQVQTSGADNASYVVHLMLRRQGHSIAYATRYVSTGQQVPYDYYAIGLCSADFSPPGGGPERGQ